MTTQSLETTLQNLLPQSLWTQVKEVNSAHDELELELKNGSSLCEVRMENDVVFLQIEPWFTFEDEEYHRLDKNGRDAFIDENTVIDSVLGQFGALGFGVYKNWYWDHGTAMLSCQMQQEVTDLRGAVALITKVFELGVRYPLTLPPKLLLAQAREALNDEYTVECANNLLDFRIRDPRGADIADYSDAHKSLAFGFILAEWCVDDEDAQPLDEVLSDMHDYVADFFRQFDTDLEYAVDEVSDVSMDKESVAIEVVYSTPCRNAKDLTAAVASHGRVVSEMVSPDWLP